MNKPITLPPIHPNIGLEVTYRRQLEKLVDEMNKSVLYWLRTAYNANRPEMAQDASPAVFLTQVMKRLAKRWEDRFEVYAKKLAKYFAIEAKDRVDGRLKSILKKSGFAVEFKMTAAANDVMQATIQENVGLIKSIASRHFEEIEGLVYRSVSTGRDLKFLTDELEKRFKVTRKRAAFIARDQNNKATAVITRVRQEGLGVTKAIWKHSHAGKTPRPEHVKWHGQEYDVSKGMWSEVDQEWVWPGTAINCFPGDTLVDLVNGCHKVWRYYYRGDLITLKAGKVVISFTANHPLLTSKGFIPGELVQEGDYIWQARNKKIETGMSDVNQTKFSFEDIFNALGSVGGSTFGGIFNFHGDTPDSEVETVGAEFDLLRKLDSSLNQSIPELNFPEANGIVGVCPATVERAHSACSSGKSEGLEFFITSFSKSQQVGLTPGSRCNSVLFEPRNNSRPVNAKMFGDSENTIPSVEHVDDVCFSEIIKALLRFNSVASEDSSDNPRRNAKLIGDMGASFPIALQVDDSIKVDINSSVGSPTLPCIGGIPVSPKVLAEFVRINTEMGSTIFETDEFIFEAVCVSKKFIRKDFSGHVYTLQSNDGWYGVGSNNLVAKNCRCGSRSIIPGLMKRSSK